MNNVKYEREVMHKNPVDNALIVIEIGVKSAKYFPQLLINIYECSKIINRTYTSFVI